MAPGTTRWDTPGHLGTHEERAAYLDAALEENDPAFFKHALDLVAAREKKDALAASICGCERNLLLMLNEV